MERRAHAIQSAARRLLYLQYGGMGGGNPSERGPRRVWRKRR